MPVANGVNQLMRPPSTDWTAILPPLRCIQGTIYDQVKMPFSVFMVFPCGSLYSLSYAESGPLT